MANVAGVVDVTVVTDVTLTAVRDVCNTLKDFVILGGEEFRPLVDHSRRRPSP